RARGAPPTPCWHTGPRSLVFRTRPWRAPADFIELTRPRCLLCKALGAILKTVTLRTPSPTNWRTNLNKKSLINRTPKKVWRMRPGGGRRDVVWKEEFRIDAAFEIENSTSIYSGLLRFADLTMVAPNTIYPLFIVSPRRAPQLGSSASSTTEFSSSRHTRESSLFVVRKSQRN